MANEIVKSKSSVANVLEHQQQSLGAEVAMKALTLVQPMIESVSKELTDTLGDNETTIVIRCSKRGQPATILFLDTKEDFTIQGARANHTTSNIARDAFIKQQRDAGNIDDEQWARMNVCDNTPVFRGEIDAQTKRPRAIKQFYVIRDFVDALLTGRVQDIANKIMK